MFHKLNNDLNKVQQQNFLTPKTGNYFSQKKWRMCYHTGLAWEGGNMGRSPEPLLKKNLWNWEKQRNKCNRKKQRYTYIALHFQSNLAPLSLHGLERVEILETLSKTVVLKAHKCRAHTELWVLCHILAYTILTQRDMSIHFVTEATLKNLWGSLI